MLTLNPDEQVWLQEYKKALEEQYPGLVQDFIIFGSKARGDAREDSDLDVLLIIREGDWRFKKQVEELGYELAIGTLAIPTILIYTVEEKVQRLQRQSSFLETVQEEGISVR